MGVGQIGEIGVHVIVITALEQELGTEPDLVPILLRHVMECKDNQRLIIQILKF